MHRSPGAETFHLREAVAEILPGVIADRRYLHRHPEVAFREEQTARLVSERLRALGADDVKTGIALTGVTALIRGTGAAGFGRTVLLRADMDALPIQEENEVEYRSEHPGVMHACGHDGHTAILLAVARLLLDRRDRFAGTVKLCFQPAEEATPGGGALPMIEAGVLVDPPVDAAFGLHLLQGLPVGRVGVRPGAVMATGTVFRIVIRGRAGHAANPQRTVDPIAIGAQILVALQTLVARETDPTEPAVVTVSSFHAGNGIGVIPALAEVRGLVKAFSDEGRDALAGRLEAMARGIAGAMRAAVDVVLEPGYPATVNDPVLTELVRAAAVETVGAERVVEAPLLMPSDDMGHVLRRVPGCYFFVGTRNEATGNVWHHHHPRYDIDEAALGVGVEALTRTALRYLASEPTPAGVRR
jgi:amidohydrolase